MGMLSRQLLHSFGRLSLLFKCFLTVLHCKTVIKSQPLSFVAQNNLAFDAVHKDAFYVPFCLTRTSECQSPCFDVSYLILLKHIIYDLCFLETSTAWHSGGCCTVWPFQKYWLIDGHTQKSLLHCKPQEEEELKQCLNLSNC